MNSKSVIMGGVEYPIETKVVEENGSTHIRFICKFPNGTEKYFRADYNLATKQNLLNNHDIVIDEQLESMILWEIRTELFQEVYGVKIADMWGRFAKSSLMGDELRNIMDKDHGFKKFVEEFYPEYAKE